MDSIHKKIRRKLFPLILVSVLLLISGFMIRLSSDAMIVRISSYLIAAAAIVMITIIGNPEKKLKSRLEELGYTDEILISDLAKGFSCGNIDVGTQFLLSYGMFTKLIFFGDVVWTYADSSMLLHFIMKDNTEVTVRVENAADAHAIAKQMEKAYPWILFGYREEIEKLRTENPADLEQLYTRKMFQCVIDGELPENSPYPSNKPRPQEPEKKETAPPYPRLPETELENITIPDSSLSGYFAEIIRLCKEYPDELNCTFHAAAKKKDISAFENIYKLKLPSQLKELLMFSNGFSLSYDDFFGLEEIGYYFNNWGALKDDDGNEYIMIANVVGDGESIVFEKESGVFFWEDHGDFTEYGDISDILEERIEFIKDFIGVE